MEFGNLAVTGFTFDSYDIEYMDVAALLFQTGYLTVKKITIEDEEKTYELSYPNHEVRNSFLTYLLGEYTQKKSGFNTRLLKRGEFFGLSPDRVTTSQLLVINNINWDKIQPPT